MIRIAIIDDNEIQCEELERDIQDNSRQLHIKMDFDTFYNAESFCDKLNQGEKYQIVFLDIELPDNSGVYVSKFLRNQIHDNAAQIVFISAKKEYAMELFQARPFDFLVKPISSQQIYACLKKYLELFQTTEYLRCKIGKTFYNIPYNSILYIESQNRVILIHTHDELYKAYTKISDVLHDCPDCFIQIHKSYVINLTCIAKHSADSVTLMDGTILHISKSYQKNFQNLLLQQHNCGGEELFS